MPHTDLGKRRLYRERKRVKHPRHEYLKRKAKEYRLRDRLRVIRKYGGVCACCGEKIIEFLTIDHINGGGKQHRRDIKVSSGSGFYVWLIRNNFPTGFRVLCYNCNSSRGAYGYCPHTQKANQL